MASQLEAFIKAIEMFQGQQAQQGQPLSPELQNLMMGSLADNFGTSDALAASVGGEGNIPGDLRGKYDSLLASEAEAGITDQPNLLERTLDVLSRPLYGVASAYDSQIQRRANDADGMTLRDSVEALVTPFTDPLDGDAWKSLGQGLAGKKKTTFGEVIREAHPDANKWVAGGAGLFLDIFADPTTYMGVGIGKKALQLGAKGTEQAVQHADDVKALAARMDDSLKSNKGNVTYDPKTGNRVYEGWEPPKVDQIDPTTGETLTGVPLNGDTIANMLGGGLRDVDEVIGNLDTAKGINAGRAVLDPAIDSTAQSIKNIAKDEFIAAREAEGRGFLPVEDDPVYKVRQRQETSLETILTKDPDPADADIIDILKGRKGDGSYKYERIEPTSTTVTVNKAETPVAPKTEAPKINPDDPERIAFLAERQRKLEQLNKQIDSFTARIDSAQTKTSKGILEEQRKELQDLAAKYKSEIDADAAGVIPEKRPQAPGEKMKKETTPYDGGGVTGVAEDVAGPGQKTVANITPKEVSQSQAYMTTAAISASRTASIADDVKHLESAQGVALDRLKRIEQDANSSVEQVAEATDRLNRIRDELRKAKNQLKVSREERENFLNVALGDKRRRPGPVKDENGVVVRDANGNAVIDHGTGIQTTVRESEFAVDANLETLIRNTPNNEMKKAASNILKLRSEQRAVAKDSQEWFDLQKRIDSIEESARINTPNKLSVSETAAAMDKKSSEALEAARQARREARVDGDAARYAESDELVQRLEVQRGEINAQYATQALRSSWDNATIDSLTPSARRGLLAALKKVVMPAEKISYKAPVKAIGTPGQKGKTVGKTRSVATRKGAESVEDYIKNNPGIVEEIISRKASTSGGSWENVTRMVVKDAQDAAKVDAKAAKADAKVTTPESSAAHSAETQAEQVLSHSNTYKVKRRWREKEAVSGVLHPDARRQNLKHNVELERAAEEHAEKIRLAAREELLTATNELLLRGYNPTSTRKALDFRIMGQTIGMVHSPAAVSKAVDRLAMTDVGRQVVNTYDTMFRAGAQSLDPFIDAARARTVGHAPELIAAHANRIRAMLGSTVRSDRLVTMTKLKNGDTVLSDTDKAIRDEIERIMDSFQNPAAGMGALELGEINRWLPEELRLIDKTDFSSVEGFLKSIVDQRTKRIKQRPLATNTSMFNRAVKNNPQDATELDPAMVIWQMNMAYEQAVSRRALTSSIAENFGVPIDLKGDKKLLDIATDLEKNHGYKRGEGQWGANTLYSPEIHEQISKLEFLMGNTRARGVVLKTYDDILGMWKSMVTVYNPGFHTRNSIGDLQASFFDGVVGPRAVRSHQQAWRALSAYHSDKDLIADIKGAMSSPTPWGAAEQASIRGNTTLFKMKNGDTVSIEQLWTLYAQNGLKTGFINTEFGHQFPLGGLRDTALGRKATGANDGLRDLSGMREDFFRMGHFIDRMKRSGITDLNEAAKEAAFYVRKYHFDYTDFTPFEKNVMVRTIPFYKFTRRNLPLMMSMMFAKPGIAMVYPKTMTNLSIALGEGQTSPDTLIPGADAILPQWVQNRGMWPMFKSENQNTVYMDMATPFNDAFKFLGDPKANALGMLTPSAKIPLELMGGKTLQGEIPVDDKSDYMLRQTPILGMILGNVKDNEKGYNEGILDALNDPRTLQYLSGVGLFENTPSQQEGAILQRSLDAAAAKKQQQPG